MGSNSSDPTIVCVLGMHRSGTSVVARLVNLLGVYLGPDEHLLKSAEDNTKGFWEHEPIMNLNDEILCRYGGSAHVLPSFSPGWEKASGLEDLRERACAIIQRDFSQTDMWGWKDPRTCLTLPFWQLLLPRMRYVICLRSPIVVAQSIQRRDGLSVEEGALHWLVHMKSLLHYTDDQPRFLLVYEDVMHDWEPGLRQLARFLGVAERAEWSEVRAAVSGFISKDLDHHHIPGIEGMDGVRVGVGQETLHKSQEIYMRLTSQGLSDQQSILVSLDEALEEVRPAAEQRRRESHERLLSQIQISVQEIERTVPPRDMMILVDQNMLAGFTDRMRPTLPFLERDGKYWGSPPDAGTAIREVERMRRSGSCFIVFAWPAFWWLDYYAEFSEYLRSHFRCVLDNDRLIAFDMRT
jgi:hypothetical protein